jgi:hypothetical protein
MNCHYHRNLHFLNMTTKLVHSTKQLLYLTDNKKSIELKLWTKMKNRLIWRRTWMLSYEMTIRREMHTFWSLSSRVGWHISTHNFFQSYFQWTMTMRIQLHRSFGSLKYSTHAFSIMNLVIFQNRSTMNLHQYVLNVS